MNYIFESPSKFIIESGILKGRYDGPFTFTVDLINKQYLHGPYGSIIDLRNDRVTINNVIFQGNSSVELKSAIEDFFALPDTSGNGIQSGTITLHNDEIRALPSMPIEIIASPGLGKVIFPIFAIIQLKNWVNDYIGIDANSSIQIITSTDHSNILVFLPENRNGSVSGVLANGDDSCAIFGIYQGIYTNTLTPPSGFDFSLFADQGLSIRMNNSGSGNLTGGDASTILKVIVNYVTIDL